MKKIMIITYYEPKDYLACIKDYFEKFGFIVTHYPLFRYVYDVNDKILDYKEHFNAAIQDQQPEIIIWWFIDVSSEIFQFIKSNNKNIYFVMYNSDDPLNLNKHLFDKAKIFDLVITPCHDSLYMYKLYSNVKNVLCGPMGYDPNTYFPITLQNIQSNQLKILESKYTCDISLIIHNTMPDYLNDLNILINKIIEYTKHKKYTLKLFGSHAIGEYHPDYYCDNVPYHELNSVFNYSKINFVYNQQKNNNLHLNEHIFPILGSKGLLLINDTKEIRKIMTDGVDCVIYDANNLVNRIDNIMNDYASFDNIKNNGYQLSIKYTWEKWTNNVIKFIGLHFFDHKFYSDMYDLSNYNMNEQQLSDRWVDQGINNKEICFNFLIPDEFDADQYIENNKIKNNRAYAYLCWFKGSKEHMYMRRKKQNSITSCPQNVMTEDYFNVCSLINKIIKYNQRDQGLIELSEYCSKTPCIPINQIIQNYEHIIFS